MDLPSPEGGERVLSGLYPLSGATFSTSGILSNLRGGGDVMIMMMIVMMMMSTSAFTTVQYTAVQYVPKDIVPTSFSLVGSRFGGLRADAVYHVLIELQQMVRG
jgi:hypothetical protein